MISISFGQVHGIVAFTAGLQYVLRNQDITKHAYRLAVRSVKVKVKQSHYKPGQAVRVPGG